MLTCKLRLLPLLPSHLFKPTISPLCLKLLQAVRQQSNATNALNSTADYIPVYHFPYIQSLAVIHKAKIYQTAATCIGIPLSTAAAMADVLPIDICAAVAAFGLSGCVLLHSLGFLTSNTVGVIYLHKDEQKSRVSYLDAWGSRKDIEIDLKEIVPFSDQPTAITDSLYLKLQQYTSKDTYKMNVKYGMVLNPKKFQVIFHKHAAE